MNLREQYQLAVVCSARPEDRSRLQAIAEKAGVADGRFVMTGFVPEEDLVALYNLCHMFIFPSWHEGFGLPALEAMACGRAVIASDRSSLPEVVNYDAALFDPFDVDSIAEKIKDVLTNDEFRVELEQHGIEQSKQFSWDKTGKRAVEALESLHARALTSGRAIGSSVGKPKLAYVSPLPPERSGISDYSAELLPALMQHFAVEVVVVQGDIDVSWTSEHIPVRSVEWFEAHGRSYDHVLYHFGNSTFHEHMFSLMKSVPGVVVLHDFFLSGILAHMELNGGAQGIWLEALYESHGYPAVIDRFKCEELVDVIFKYPANLPVLSRAQGVIVHSENSRKLAQDWYGPQAALDWEAIPLLRVSAPAATEERQAIRARLGLNAEDFVVCSFGLLGPSKLNDRLLDAWLNSPLAQDPSCVLVFVGQNEAGSYGDRLASRIDKAKGTSRIQITGWASSQTFRDYLAVADVGVQLRTHSRGETSAAVLDCMNHGLATIVNANGSMGDLDEDCVIKLPDEFSDAHLVDALIRLWRNPEARKVLGAQASALVHTRHAPEPCAARYRAAIERFHCNDVARFERLIRAIEAIDPKFAVDEDLLQIADAVDRSFPATLFCRQALLDVTPFMDGSLDRGRARETIRRWLEQTPAGVRLEPVYVHREEHQYHYARAFTLEMLDCPANALHDSVVVPRQGDVLYLLDDHASTGESAVKARRALERKGVVTRHGSE